jgi:hypothetical protein
MANKQQKQNVTKAKSKQANALQSVDVAREQTRPQLQAGLDIQHTLASPLTELQPNHVLTLQRAAGNRAVNRLVAANAGRKSRTRLPIQARLTVGPANDSYEQEADRVAAQVTSQINAPQSQSSQTGQNVQRQQEDEELKRKPLVQFKSTEGGMNVSADLESSIQAARSGGQPIAENVRAPMESAFGTDFGGVKVHTDSEAHTLNRSVQARAFTTGQDIFFREGEYKPNSKEGQQLLAHELTHVVQQNGSQLQRKAPNEKVEQEPKQDIKQVTMQKSGQIQRRWYVWGQIAIWVQENSSEVKTSCPEGYEEVEGTRELYGEGWQPYVEPNQVGTSQGHTNTDDSPMKGTKKLAIHKISQQEKGWCFAAVSKIVDGYVAKTNVPLWKYVQAFHAKNNPGVSNMDEQTIREQFGNSYGLEFFLHTVKGDQNVMLTEDSIFQSLYLMDSPLVLGLGQHSYIMYGYDPTTKQLFLWDPLANAEVDYYTLASLNEMYMGSLEVIHSFQPK